MLNSDVEGKALFGSNLAVNDVAYGILGQDSLPASDQDGGGA